MKLSIGGFSFNNLRVEGKMDIFAYIETVYKRYQLQGIDFWNAFFADTTRPLWQIADDDMLHRIRQALVEREMNLVNIAVDRAHIWDPDPEIREALHQNALAHLRAAEIMGAQSVRIDAVLHGDDVLSDEALEYITMRYREYAQRGAEGGYWVGPENHTGCSLQPDTLVRISEEVNHPNYGILLHIGRWKPPGDSFSIRNATLGTWDSYAIEGDLQAAPWVRHTHVDYRLIESPDAKDRLASLKNAGYNGYWAIEYNAPYDQLAAMDEAIGKLKGHLASLSA
ncbi:TIM barrel protein [Paenibacillus sp. S-12]|uniref:sugar phosphate isomerase/epimerase family protein n=1 Tax=Paenibacillus sp. S-12 TaxID=3031371 RepID=UPI0025A2CDBE|nr:TIM barrel protein [Paenibacillus sp. S-12]